MPFELSAGAHFFTTFATLVAAVLFFIMGSHMGISVAFIFITTFVTMIPSAFGIGSNLTIQVSRTLKFLVTALFWAWKFFC